MARLGRGHPAKAIIWHGPAPTGGGTQNLAGVLFQKAPTFPTGAVTATRNLAGTLFVKAPTFPQGAVTSTYALTGTLFQKAPTFPQGDVALASGTQNLAGSLFTKAPTFPTGTVTTAYNLTGVLFTRAPTFPAGSVVSTYALTGTLFVKAPTFPTGAVTSGAVNLAGVLFQKAPTFFTGVVSAAGDVEFDAVSESHTGTTGSVSEASFSWSHNPVGTPRGVLVFTFVNDSTADDALAVTYGGTALTAVTGGRALDTLTELGDVKAWFLGASVPTADPATVVVTRTNNATVMYAVAVTVTASVNLAVHLPGIVLLQENQALTEQSVTDGSPGSNSLRFAALNSGLAAESAVPPGANSTALVGIDFGARVISTVRETVPGQGSRLVGFEQVTGDDVAAVHLAVRSAPAAQALTGSLFTKAPTFPTGTVTATRNLVGVLFVKAPTFFVGTVTATRVLTGTLFQKAPTFSTGTVTAGAVNLAGTLFVKAPTFPTGLVTQVGGLTGVLYVNTPLFFTGAMSQTGGSFWTPNPVAFTVNPAGFTLNPVAFVAVGPAGPIPWPIAITGNLFVKAPTFPVGAVT